MTRPGLLMEGVLTWDGEVFGAEEVKKHEVGHQVGSPHAHGGALFRERSEGPAAGWEAQKVVSGKAQPLLFLLQS